MKLAAIICEYNPFHNGHKFHIEETRRKTGADGIVAIMSGNLVQRGDVAIFDKHARSKAAVLGGADLVIELPSIYALASAEIFALNAVKTLNSLGIIDYLSFGAETENISTLVEISKLLNDDSPLVFNKLKPLLKTGMSYPAALSRLVGEILGKDYEAALKTPNNILAIEYIKAILKTNSTMSALPILRNGASHDSLSPSGDITSASHIRALLEDGELPYANQFMPQSSSELFASEKIHSLKPLEKAIIAHLIKEGPASLSKAPDISEGLENRIYEAALSSVSLDELFARVKTKRYTHSRIRRIILCSYFGITEEMRSISPQYITILSHNQIGQKIIAKAKMKANLPIVRNTAQVNKLKNPLVKSLWEQQRTFDKIYDLTEHI